MNRIVHIVLFFLIVSSVDAQTDILLKEIKQIILNDTDITLRDTPGFIIGIVDGEETYYVHFGTIAPHSEDTLSTSSIFELGSVSKVFTSSLVSILVDDGMIAYEDKVNQYIPQRYRNPRLEELQIIDLVRHYSSLPIRPHFFGRRNIDPDNPYKYYEKKNLLDFYRRYVPQKEDLNAFRYAHTNYGLLEIVLEHATQQSYETLLRQHIFEPLDMQHSFVHLPEDKDNTLTEGYDRAVKKATPWQFASFAASEGVKSTMEDLVSFLRANVGLSYTHLDAIFDRNTNPELETNFNKYIKTAKGWQMLRQGKSNIVTHSGKTGGYNAFIGLVKETQTGVIVLANSAKGTENLGILILRMINNNWKRKTP